MPDILENAWRRSAGGVALWAALALCACAPGSTDLQSRRDAALTLSVPEHSEPQMCRPDRTLLVPVRAPDCGFGRSDLKTLDPDEWARLKVEYERKCYQSAEMAVREKLRRLQAANRCETASARP
jgi:hypothetical protein